jgi:hypothetical protein
MLRCSESNRFCCALFIGYSSLGNKKYYLGIVSDNHQLIKTVSDVVYELDTQNIKYDEYTY